MTTSFTPHPQLLNVAANPIYDSRDINTSSGERKLRANLLQVLDTGVDSRNADILNQFFIAVSGGVETYENSKKTALLPGRVAVKIKTEGTEGEKNVKCTYIFLNLNSLSKRLGLDKKTIKKAEADGILDQVIVNRVKELAEIQASIENMIVEIHGGRKDVFSEEDDENPLQPQLGTINKDLMERFIKEHFSNDSYLMENLNAFLDDPTFMGLSEASNYLEHLIGNLWWTSDALKKLTKEEVHKKYAISSHLTDPNFPVSNSPIKFVYGTAASRADNKGTREVTRVRLFDWDKDNRYALALEDDFIYTSEPAPRSKNEVALKLPFLEGSWVLVNKNSLKRVGIYNIDAYVWFEGGWHNILQKIVELRIGQINDASTLIEEIKSSFAKDGWMIGDKAKKLNKYMDDYPDEKFKEITADFLKKYREKAQQEKVFDGTEEVKKEFLDFIARLEQHHLVSGKREEAAT